VTKALAKVGAAFVPWDSGAPGDSGAYDHQAKEKAPASKKARPSKKAPPSESEARAKRTRQPKLPASGSRPSTRAPSKRAEEGPRTSRSPMSLDDAAALKEIRDYLEAEGSAADWPDIRHIWINGGREAVRAWKDLHKIASWGEAMETWVVQHHPEVLRILALPRAA
jgi:hypothetical protein